MPRRLSLLWGRWLGGTLPRATRDGFLRHGGIGATRAVGSIGDTGKEGCDGRGSRLLPDRGPSRTSGAGVVRGHDC